MRKEEKYAFEEVEDITPPACPVCHGNTLRNTDALDTCDFGLEGIFEMWQNVECDHCGVHGRICYTLDFEDGGCSLDFAKEEVSGGGSLMTTASVCPSCGHIVASTWDGQAAKFDTLPVEIPTDELLVKWHCPECGADGVIRLYPSVFQADEDWLDIDDPDEA